MPSPPFKIFKLSSRNLEIVELRQVGFTLREIGSHFQVTRERIRQIVEKSLQLFANSIEAQTVKFNVHAGLRENNFFPTREVPKLISEIRPDLTESSEILAESVLDIISGGDASVVFEYDILFSGRQAKQCFQDLVDELLKLKLNGEKVLRQEILARTRHEEKLGQLRVALIRECWPELRSALAAQIRVLRRQATSTKLAERILLKHECAMHWQDVAEAGNKIRCTLGLKPLNARSFLRALRTHDEFAYRDQGTYGLRSWGGDVPYIKDALIKILEEEEAPLTFGQLKTRISEVREVKKSSLDMYLSLHKEFYASRSGKFGLRDWLPDRPTIRTERDFVETPASARRLD